MANSRSSWLSAKKNVAAEGGQQRPRSQQRFLTLPPMEFVFVLEAIKHSFQALVEIGGLFGRGRVIVVSVPGPALSFGGGRHWRSFSWSSWSFDVVVFLLLRKCCIASEVDVQAANTVFARYAGRNGPRGILEDRHSHDQQASGDQATRNYTAAKDTVGEDGHARCALDPLLPVRKRWEAWRAFGSRAARQ